MTLSHQDNAPARGRDRGRSRTAKAERRQRKVAASLDTSWQKHARCVICRRRYVVNNYSDRRVRVNQDKIAGRIVCIWCRCRRGKFIIQLMLIAEKVAEGHCELLGNEDTCGCLTHVTRRILKAAEEEPLPR